ncbi:hypothetical protein PMAYCL1PPCAC_26786, partial [Pristionchus mayeri]
LSTVTEEDSDWAAFQTSSAPVSGKKESVSVDDSDDWAAFESAAPAAERQPSVDDDDDWATDFASAPPPPAAAAAAAAPPPEVSKKYWLFYFICLQVPKLPSLAELSIDEGIWSSEDTIEEIENVSGFAFDLFVRLDADDPREQKGAKGGEDEDAMLLSASLWLSLRVVEEAAALQHTWEGSKTARQLHHLLQLRETRPLQRAQLAAAVLPSADAVLQPTKIGEANGTSSRSVTLSTSASSISYAHSSAATSYSVAGCSSSMASTTLGSGVLLPTTSSQARSPAVGAAAASSSVVPPPVDFDWESSALKTPAVQLSSGAMLDMDYFTSTGGPPKIISSDFTLQRDLDAFGLSATSASAGMPRVESTP